MRPRTEPDAARRLFPSPSIPRRSRAARTAAIRSRATRVIRSRRTGTRLQLLIKDHIMPMPRKPTPERYCEQCGMRLERKRYPNGDLEYLINFNRRKFCNQRCMGLSFDQRHSPDVGWSTAHYHARRAVPKGPCSRCGKPNAKDVHHRDGNHRNNSPENLERICRSCHNRVHKQRGSCVICGEPQKGLGYCVKHYQRFKRHGDPQSVKTPPRSTCKCGGAAHAKGLWGKNYMQAKRRGELDGSS